MEADILPENKVLILPKISLLEAKNIVFDLYGLKVIKILELNGYDDKNFHILVDHEVNNNDFIHGFFDCGYVLKVINSLDSQNESSFEAQTALLCHLESNNIRCPKQILTKDGKPFSKISLHSGSHIVRLLEFIDGQILFNIPCAGDLFYEVGVLAAKIDNALVNFDHPAYHSKILWCLGSAPDILNYLYVIKNESKKEMVKKTISEFSFRVLAIEENLEKGIIHGDINEQNIIAEEKNNQWHIKAILDFGDTHYACYLYELALAMAYMIFLSNDISSGGYVLAGYSSVRNVSEQEFQLLRICVLARYCQSLVMGAYSSLKNPTNAYVLTTAEKGWELLETILNMPEESVLKRWKEIASSFFSV